MNPKQKSIPMKIDGGQTLSYISSTGHLKNSEDRSGRRVYGLQGALSNICNTKMFSLWIRKDDQPCSTFLEMIIIPGLLKK